MALMEVKKIIVRASTDPDFRSTLFAAPDSVLSKYDLSEEEKQCIKELDEERLSEAIRIESLNGVAKSNDIRI